MRLVMLVGMALFLGALAAACAYWAGAAQGAPIALALVGLTLSVVIPVSIGQLSNWGVPGDEPKLPWRRTQ